MIWWFMNIKISKCMFCNEAVDFYSLRLERQICRMEKFKVEHFGRREDNLKKAILQIVHLGNFGKSDMFLQYYFSLR